jgi:hypothetical protein
MLLAVLWAQLALAEDLAGELEADLACVERISMEMAKMEQEMHGLRRAFKVLARGFYTAEEHDQIERLLFRYLVCREALWEVVHRYRTNHESLKDPLDRARAFTLGFSAALQLSHYSSTLVKTFHDEKIVVAKLNEGYHRTRISEGTWDSLFSAVTQVEHLQAMRGAWDFYYKEMSDPRSSLSRLRDSDPRYRKLLAQITRFFRTADDNVVEILEAHSLLFPDFRNQLRHSIANEVLSKAKIKVDDGLVAARAVLFHRVSRLKNPTATLSRVSDRQFAAMRERLRPGDLILTYAAGYMSNVFLPGTFKHGITYVGTPTERKRAGINASLAATLPDHVQDPFRANLVAAETRKGRPADLIEAVAEGVKFSSLQHLLATHINRMVVLRPRLRPSERNAALTTTFSLLGNAYDFGFDFNDGTYQCCTEVIYRSMHKRGPLRFVLTSRMGKPTLSADDIINQHLAAEKPMFDVVMLAEPNAAAPTHATVHLDQASELRLRQLMAVE